MRDPEILVLAVGPFTLWHHDPCTDGSDDSCGWCPRARHGNPAVLRRIKSGVAMDWMHLFSDLGNPLMSTAGIVINLFWWAAFEHFKNPRLARRWMRRNLFEILFFAENPTDSLHSAITGKYGEDREGQAARIERLSQCVYGWVLRETRPWWRHPRWHVWHWRISCRPFWKRRLG